MIEFATINRPESCKCNKGEYIKSAYVTFGGSIHTWFRIMYALILIDDKRIREIESSNDVGIKR